MRAAPFAVYGTFSCGQYVSPRIGCEVTTGANNLLDLVRRRSASGRASR